MNIAPLHLICGGIFAVPRIRLPYEQGKEQKDHIVVLIAAVFAAAMVIFPQTTEAGSKTAISLWLNSIVPVMLPFISFRISSKGQVT